MSHIDVNLNSIVELIVLASVMNFLISSAVRFPISALRVSSLPPLMMRLSLIAICLTRSISSLVIPTQMLISTLTASADPPNWRQQFTWKSLSVYSLLLSANAICFMLAPYMTDDTIWEPYFLRKASYLIHDVGHHGRSIWVGNWAKSDRNDGSKFFTFIMQSSYSVDW